MNTLIYLDNNSTTPVDPVVFETMRPYFTEFCGNPSNQHHYAGSRAACAMEKSRAQVAAAIGAEPESVVFTSGATESNNLAILGVCSARRLPPGHIVTSAIEHKAVIEPCRHLEAAGWKVTVLRPDRQGLVDWRFVEDAITPETTLVSIMAANNEVGTIQPIERIGEVCERRGVLFHCDAAQALGRIPVDVGLWNVDLLSLSAHKAYGPKGVGALVVRERRKSELLTPLCFGGGQESGIRPGTPAVPNIVGFGAAAELASANLLPEAARLRSLRQDFLSVIKGHFPDLVVHGHPTNSLPGLLSAGFPGVNGDEFLFTLRDVAISQGAACTAGSPEPSHVLTAMGIAYDLARSSFRFGIGRFTTNEDIMQAAAEVSRVLSLLA
ncbi:MAG: cysteine desulfurase [Planctomycetota bacterium]|nr:MAG: cysteine desulfurase [Planctomycetota bacterium]